ncbi:MAG: HAD hydrolase-like protein [Collinsella sp.]|nr:HAD hydrolase-like protein [Collinsella sp.]
MLEGQCFKAGAVPCRPVVLFDFDGTVVDSTPAIFRVAGEVMAKHGCVRTHEEMRPMIGPPLEEGFRLVCGFDDDEVAICAREYRDIFSQTVTAREFPLMPGMADLLDDLRRAGRRLAIATSRMESSAVQMVSALGLDHFEAVIGRVPGVRYSKAESIGGALEALSISPKDAIMVGDREHDVLGAADWGMPCIGIYTGGARPGELERAGAIATCDSVGALRELLGLWTCDACGVSARGDRGV